MGSELSGTQIGARRFTFTRKGATFTKDLDTYSRQISEEYHMNSWLEFINRAGANRHKAQPPIPDKPKDGMAAKPKAFKNDPDDPSNPNEARERHHRNINP